MSAQHPHGSACCYIIPPYLLQHLVLHGTEQERMSALRSLSIDSTTRAGRALFMAVFGRVKNPLLATLPNRKSRTILNANYQENRSGTVVRIEGQSPTSEFSVDEAYDGLGATYDFFLSAYQRNSIDDQGLPLKGIVHYGQGYNNAFWDGQEMVFGDGDGQLFNRFTSSVDVIGHELTHGVVGAEADLMYLRQPGALNESIADVFGTLVKQYMLKQKADQADWLIGQGLFVKDPKSALRSMKAPGTAYDLAGLGKDPQPSHFKNYVDTMEDNGGVHLNSGIPNHAFYLAAISIGGYAWEKTGRIWYETLRDPHLKKTADFIDFAYLTSRNASNLYGSQSVERKAVVAAWREVGVPVEV